ncbi:hypothetical protein [Allosalinactinospora lopnorensis]|uniref:hypothetical protein n=1 Tax=Allosalinactinospora lopnorensis TaxID=1352348 RepID=UPI000623F7AD|nr:hypothetical protein [Allosalinactinospora lopnorensis]
MPSWAWIGVLLLACVILAIWRLVQWTGQPRRFFRAGLADPEREEFAPEERGAHAPETVEEPTERGLLETTLDEEVAEFVQGRRHEATPITTDVDRETGRLLDEELLGEESRGDGGRVQHRPAEHRPRAGEDEGAAAEQRRMAADEHRRAAEEHRRAAEALTPEEEAGTAPSEQPADGPQQPRRGGTGTG